MQQTIYRAGMVHKKEEFSVKLYNIVFSPTGGTQKAAELLTHALGGEAATIDLADSQYPFSAVQLTQEDVAVIAVPSYGGRVPAVAVDRLTALNGQGARAVLLCVYGNRAYEDTLVELEDAARKAGFRVIAGVAAVAEHSIARQFASGRPDAQDAQQLAAFAEQIRQKLSGNDLSEPALPGNRPYKKAGGVGMAPKATKACNRCGACAAQCPVQAIPKEDPTKVDEKACISCMRCVAVCPQGARKVNPLLLSAAGLMLKKVCVERKECELFL